MGRRVQIGWLQEHALYLDEDEDIDPFDLEPLSAVKAGDRYSLNGGPAGEYGYLPVFVEVED